MEAQLDKELSFHIEQHTEQLVARGHAPDEARRQARLALGGPEQVKEKCRDARGTRWLEDLLQDSRYAGRTFRQKPGFAIVALLILALGIGATTVMFAVINSVLLRPLPYPEPDRLITVHGFTQTFGEFWGSSNPDFIDAQRESRSLDIAGWTYGGGTISEPGEPQYVDGRKISANLFSTLDIAPLYGRAFRADEDRPGAAPVTIISHSLWQRDYGGNPAAIGSSLVFEGQEYSVVGIAPAGFQLSGEADVFTPLGQSIDPRMRNREAHFIHAMARLRPGFTLAEAQAELTLMALHLAEQYPKSNGGLGMIAHPLQHELVGDIGSTLWLLLSAVGLVLLIACVNIASLLLARAVSRDRELAMRIALGAGRGRLARQCLTESAILGLTGGMLGVLFAAMSVRPFVLLWPGSLPRAEEVHLDWRVLVFSIAASLFSGLLFGLAPALRVPTRGFEQALRAGARSIAGSSRRLHSVFVVSEIALAVVLLVAAGMLGRTLLSLSSLDPGLNAHNILTARFALSPVAMASPEQIRAAWQDVLDRAGTVPGVESIALTDIIPMREGENSGGYWTTPTPPPPNQTPMALIAGGAAEFSPQRLNHCPPLEAARQRIARPATLPFAPVRHLRRFGSAAGLHRHLWRAGLLDRSARPRNRCTHGAWRQRSQRHVARAPPKHRNDFRRHCRRGFGGAVSRSSTTTSSGRNAAHGPVDFRRHHSRPDRRGASCQFCTSASRQPHRPNHRPLPRLKNEPQRQIIFDI
jgi:predicted permease